MNGVRRRRGGATRETGLSDKEKQVIIVDTRRWYSQGILGIVDQ